MSEASSCSSRLGSTSVAPKAHRQVQILVRFIKFIYLDGCTELGSHWLVGWLLGNKTMACHIASLHLLCFPLLRWLTQDFKCESHLTLFEVSVREQGQRRLPARKESHRPPLVTLMASACVRLYNISNPNLSLTKVSVSPRKSSQVGGQTKRKLNWTLWNLFSCCCHVLWRLFV